MKTVVAMKTTTAAAARGWAGCRWSEELQGGLGVFVSFVEVWERKREGGKGREGRWMKRSKGWGEG